MSNYTLLGKTVTFSKAEDNYYELQEFFSKQLSGLYNAYEGWYTTQGGAANVINNIETYFKDSVEKLILKPLYPTLSMKYSIFGVSQSEYFSICMDISGLYSIRSEAIEIYEDIQECMEAEIAEREEEEQWRKAGQISFGIGDSLKNAASNAAHGIAKSGGNASSREKATERKNKLYNEIKEPLWDALIDSLNISLTNHMNLINERVPNSIGADFNMERSEAYLDNAKMLPEKQEELLIKAFISCPWNSSAYSYIFEKYPDERKNLIEISKNYNVDLTNDIDAVFRALYTPEAKKTEGIAIEVKTKILNIMADWNIHNSVVIDEIETDCLHRIVKGVKNATEEECNKMKVEVERYDALDKNKTEFLKMITTRIEEIWAKEDGEIFDNYLLNANILSSYETKEGVKLVQDRGRTDDANRYLKAFQTCTDRKNVLKARAYQMLSKKDSFLSVAKYIGYGFVILGVILMLVVAFSETMDEDAAFTISWCSVLSIAVGVIYQKMISKMKRTWEDITVNGTVINHALTMSKEDFKRLSFAATSIDVKAYANNTSNPETLTENESEETK